MHKINEKLILDRGNRLDILLSTCIVKRRAELVHLLSSFPPNQKLLDVSSSGGESVLEFGPPTSSEWQLYLKSSQGALAREEPGLDALYRVQTVLDERREALVHRIDARDSLQNQFERLVALFEARLKGNDIDLETEFDSTAVVDAESVRSLETITIVHHARAVSAGNARSEDLSSVYRAMLMQQQGVFSKFEDMQRSIDQASKNYEKVLDQNDWIVAISRQQRKENVVLSPWRMTNLEETVAALRRRACDLFEEISSASQSIRESADDAEGAEYVALMTGLARKMNRLNCEDRVEEFTKLQADVVEPLLKRYAPRLVEDEFLETTLDGEGGVVEAVWDRFFELDDSNVTAEILDLEHAKAQVKLLTQKERLNNHIRKKSFRYHLVGTLLAVHQNLLVVQRVDSMVPKVDDPKTLLDVVGRVATTEFFKGTPREQHAVADCALFALEWFGFSDAFDHLSIPPKRHGGEPLPSVGDVASALQERLFRAREMVAFVEHAKSGFLKFM